MAGKKQHETFNKKVNKLLLSLGAKETGKEMYKYSLETKGGLLWITTHEPVKNDVFSVYCRFDDPTKAGEALKDDTEYGRLNRHSGKWNWHSFDAQNLLSELERNLISLKEKEEA